MVIKRVLPVLFLLTLVSALPTTPGAQSRQRSSDPLSDDWCQRDRGNSDREQVCEVRRFNVTSSGTMTVDAEPNGGIQVQGDSRSDILVEAKVTAQAETQARAKQLVDSVRVTAQPHTVSADGPSGMGRREWWSVSYRLAVPMVSSLSLRTTNGGISIRDVEGQIDFKTVNGGVTLTNLAGDVKGRTTNGGVNVDLEGTGWKGEGLEVETSNGGVNLRIPEQYAARLETGTQNGGMNIDFPITVQGRLGRINRQISADINGGGAPIRVTTHNGGVRIIKK
jgi:Putative adhesin